MLNNNSGEGMLKAYARMLADMGHQDLEVVVGGSKAYSTKNRIVIPSMPIHNEKALITATGYAMHEEGHINATDFDIWPQEPLLAKVSNWFEDIRIEARQMQRFLGARARLARLMGYLIEDGFFGEPSADQTPAQRISSYVLYTLRATVLGQQALGDYAKKAEALVRDVIPPGAMARLSVMMFKVEDATCTQDCIDLANSILSMLQEEQEKAEQQQAGKSDDEAPSNEDQADTDNEPAADQGTSSDTDADGSSDGPVTDDSLVDDGSAGESGSSKDSSEGKLSCEESGVGYPETFSQEELAIQADNLKKVLNGVDQSGDDDVGEMLARALNTLHDENRTTAIEIPPSKLLMEGRDNPAQIIGRVGDATKALKRRVNNLLEGLDRERRYNTSSGSRLDTRRMMGVARGETKVFMKRIDGVQMNTAVQILIDRSGSMDLGRRVVVAAETALALSFAFEGIKGLQASVAAFPFTIQQSENGVGVLSEFGERAAHAASRFTALGADGCTPMGEALLWSGCRLANRREERKILFVITDGQPEAYGELSSVSRGKARAVMAEMERNGIEVIALGIKIDVSLLFNNSRKIDDLAELPTAVFEMIQSKLLERQAA